MSTPSCILDVRDPKLADPTSEALQALFVRGPSLHLDKLYNITPTAPTIQRSLSPTMRVGSGVMAATPFASASFFALFVKPA